jgi:hypothetical protein
MRVNVYAEEMTDRIEIVSKEIDGHVFTGLRFYLELPASFVPDGERGMRPADVSDPQQAAHFKAPFIHRPGDDDSSAITFWGKRDLREVLKLAQEKLDKHYSAPTAAKPEV